MPDPAPESSSPLEPRTEASPEPLGLAEVPAERRLGPSAAQLLAYLSLGLVNALWIAVLPLPPGGLVVRADHHFFDAGHWWALGLTAALAAAVPAWFGLRHRAVRWVLLAALGAGVALGVLRPDLDGLTERLTRGPWAPTVQSLLAVAGGLSLVVSGWVGTRLARPWLRWLPIVGALGLAVAQQFILTQGYPGGHFLLALNAATLGATAATGTQLPNRRSAPPDSRMRRLWSRWRVRMLLTIGLIWATASVAVRPSNPALLELFRLDGSVVAWQLGRLRPSRTTGQGTIPAALRKLGYSDREIPEIVDYVNREDTIEGAPHLKPEHLPVFDCADRPRNGSRSIHYLGHIKMAGAVQPFLSGAISKTVNLPNEATVDEIMQAYLAGWEKGMKSVSIYRDGCKKVQPLSNKEIKKQEAGKPVHRNMPTDHPAWEHEFRIKGFKGFLTMGMYPEDSTLGEIFLNFAKQGSTLQGMAMAWAIAISMGLQRGVPLEDYVRMFAHMSFEPSGMTTNQQIPFATSIPDYVVRYLATRYLSKEAQESLGIHFADNMSLTEKAGVAEPQFQRRKLEDPRRTIEPDSGAAPACLSCGNIMQRNGSCYICTVCGTTSGCS